MATEAGPLELIGRQFDCLKGNEAMSKIKRRRFMRTAAGLSLAAATCLAGRTVLKLPAQSYCVVQFGLT